MEVSVKNRFLLILPILIILILPLNAANNWAQQSPSTSPSARYYHDMASLGNGNVLMFGGWNSTYTLLSDTWIYNYSTDTWTSLSLGTYPSARRGHGMAYIGYDDALLFGGNTGTRNNETWLFDGTSQTWSQLSPISSPSARDGFGIAVIVTDKVLLFGGDVGGVNGETWVFDRTATSWTQLSPAASPSARYHHNMAYIGDDKVILFGGATPTTNNETWVYDLSDNNWTNMNPGTWVSGTDMPSARTDFAMEYLGDDKVILFGSSNADGTTWIYDLSDNSWTIDANSTSPNGRLGPAMAISSPSGERRVVHFGGRDASLNFTNETWIFGGGDYPLPVELSSFIVELTLQGVLCKWTTESEIENLGFLLERKTEGADWTELTSYKTDNGLLGQGTTSYPTEYEYLDIFVEPNTTYEYRLADVDYNGVVTYHSVRTVTVEKTPLPSILEEFTVLPAYPNPFNPSTTITYGINGDSKVTIEIYDITGKLINTLQDKNQSQGWHSVIWNGTNQFGEQAPAGLYLSRITSGNNIKTNKLMLLK